MKTVEVKTIADPDELTELSKELIAYANDNKIWAFYGEMGAGKTTFIRIICQALGVKENVSSPTFSLINEYHDAHDRPIFHFDFFRIENEQEAINIGCEEYFESGSLCLVEWPEKILNLLPHPHTKIDIVLDDSKRRITFSHE